MMGSDDSVLVGQQWAQHCPPRLASLHVGNLSGRMIFAADPSTKGDFHNQSCFRMIDASQMAVAMWCRLENACGNSCVFGSPRTANLHGGATCDRPDLPLRRSIESARIHLPAAADHGSIRNCLRLPFRSQAHLFPAVHARVSRWWTVHTCALR